MSLICEFLFRVSVSAGPALSIYVTPFENVLLEFLSFHTKLSLHCYCQGRQLYPLLKRISATNKITCFQKPLKPICKHENVLKLFSNASKLALRIRTCSSKPLFVTMVSCSFLSTSSNLISS